MKNILIIGCGLLGSSLLRRISKKKIAANAAKAKTISEPIKTSLPVGQVTLNASCFTL